MANDLRLVNAACALGCQTEHGKAHRNAVVPIGLEGCAVRFGTAVNDHAVVGLLNVHACLGQLGDHSGNAVGLLDLELLRVADNGLALSECSGYRDDRQLVDQTRDDSAADLHAVQLAVLDGQVAHRLGLIAEVRLGDVRAHVAQYIKNTRAGRVDAHVFNRQLTARNDRTGNEEERRGRNIARGPQMSTAMEILRRVERDGAAVGLNLNAECSEHALGVVAGGSRLDNGRLTLGVQTCQQDGALQLSGCYRQTVFNTVQLAREQGQRAEIVVLALNGRAHFTQRLHHAAHRALLDGRVAAHGNGERLTGQNAAQQAGGRAGVAGIQRF